MARYKEEVTRWLATPPSAPLIVCGDSKLEAVAFLCCLLESEEPAFKGLEDRVLVFSSADALRRLTTVSPTFIPIVFTDEVERELGAEFKNKHVIIVRPRNTVEPMPDIALEALGYEAFRDALAAMGIKDTPTVDRLAQDSGRSPTILRRRRSPIPAIKNPEWATKWEAASVSGTDSADGHVGYAVKGDCEIVEFSWPVSLATKSKKR